MAHAKLSPSSAERWMTCPGSIRLTKDLPNDSSAYADEGTAAHALAERILCGAEPDSLMGQIDPETKIEWSADMLVDVRRYTDSILALVKAVGGTLLVEQRLSISEWTGEEDAHGTSDAVILAGDELIISDLKFGRGVVVEADHNRQLMIYALAAYRQFEMVAEFKRVRLIISQPRLYAWSEWSLSVEELLAFGEAVKRAAEICNKPDAPLQPSEKGCKFCKAKATCPALRAEVDSMFDGVVPATATEDTLASAMSKVKLVEDWCKAVRAETERRLLAGVPVTGYKLVQGKMGNRKWADPAEAEAVLKSLRMKVEEMYDLSLISPTTAEKLVGTAIGPRQWKKVLPLITRTEGQPSVAPESDKRPAITVSVVDETAFDAMSAADFI